jgi:fatty acid synthase subunit alpha
MPTFQNCGLVGRMDGLVAEDLGDMTYEEVTPRMVHLMFVGKEGRWINLSLRNLTGDWLMVEG